MEKVPTAVVLLSGGLDSITTLAIAQQKGYVCHCLSFDYGQRHRAELDAAKKLAIVQRAAEHRIVSFDLAQFGGSALTDTRLAIPTDENQPMAIPITYVPARNTVMLAMALAWAEVLDARAIFVGVNAIDFSGYPDCRPEFIAAFEHMANLATRAGVEGTRISIEAPLIKLSKAEIIRLGTELGIDYAMTVSCYQPDQSGRACGSCEACRLRRKGFDQAGIPDSTRYRPGIYPI